MRSAIVLGVVAVTWGAPAASKRCIASAEYGQQLEKEGKLIDASRAYQECTASECPTVVRRDCARWVEALEGKIPTVTFKLEDESGHESTEGRVLVDGEPARGVEEGRAVPVDPGPHRFTWVRSTSVRVETQVVVREGEKGRIVALRAERAERSAAPRAAEPLRTEPAAPPASSGKGPLPWISGIGGTALALGGAALWTVGMSERNKLADGCARTHSCAQDDVDASRTKLIVGDVLIGVGVVAIGAAVWLFLRDDAKPSPGTTAVNF